MTPDLEPAAAPAPLRFTGHPFVDVGAAAIAAYCRRRRPEDVTGDDLRTVVRFIEEHYFRDPFKSLLISVFPNSAYVNPTMGADKRRAYIETYVKAFDRTVPPDGGLCAFCGRTAAGAAYRQHIPLIAGEGVVNYGPSGRPGLHVCGVCLLCIQTLPLGCDRCEGRLLLAYADDPALTLALTRECVQANQRSLSLGPPEGDARSGMARQFPRTLLLQRLMAVMARQEDGLDAERHVSLAAYHLTNYPTNADVRIYALPSRVLAFVQAAQRANYRPAWRAIAGRSWIAQEQRAARKGRGGSPPAEIPTARDPEPGTARNSLYEAVFGLPEEAPRFVRRFLLRRSQRAGQAESLGVDLELLSWPLTALFLEVVLDMDADRIARIRRLGDRLARLVDEQNDRALLRNLYQLRQYDQLRGELIKAESAALRRGDDPVITFDDFINIFEESEEFPRLDWRLARDLMLIRMLEQLRERKLFQRDASALTAIQDAAGRDVTVPAVSDGSAVAEQE